MLRLRLWDVSDSSLNPPTRWSSSLYDGKQMRTNKEHLDKSGTFFVCVFVFYTCPPYWRRWATWQLSRGAGPQSRCWNRHSEPDKQLRFLMKFKSWQTLKMLFLTEAKRINLTKRLKECLPVCRSTTKWQVVASSDPSTDTLPIIGNPNKHKLPLWSWMDNLHDIFL